MESDKDDKLKGCRLYQDEGVPFKYEKMDRYHYSPIEGPLTIVDKGNPLKIEKKARYLHGPFYFYPPDERNVARNTDSLYRGFK